MTFGFLIISNVTASWLKFVTEYGTPFFEILSRNANLELNQF